MVGRISFAIIESFLIDPPGWVVMISTCRFIAVPMSLFHLYSSQKATWKPNFKSDDEDVEQPSRREFHGGEDRI